ncbi:hypothetical protein C8Q77DRAFT_1071307 [Trametes polyzona]|nr:hypothetical protein C8Q77DRAFT_1071307 [Trametes polyzona]
MASRLDYLLHDLPAPARHRPPYLPPPPTQLYASSSSHHQLDWRLQAPHSALFAGPLATSSWTNAGPSTNALWPSGPPDFLLPFHHYPPKQYDAGPGYSVARSDTSSAISRDSDLSPSPEVAEVVCNAPLVAPVPLPYHSPTFLMYDLPDEDEDLSHPPYTHRPHKRKRAREESEDSDDSDSRLEGQSADAQYRDRDTYPVPAKRRALGLPGGQRWDAAGQDASAAAAAALRHPAAGFSRRNRAR